MDRLGRTFDAISAYNHVAAVDPETGQASLVYADAKLREGEVLQRLGYSEQALIAYDLSLEVAPYYATTWFHKAVILEEAGRAREALEAYERVLSINPDHPAAISKKSALLQQ